MTESERRIARALRDSVSFLPGSWDKRFVRNMADVAGTEHDITDKQAAHLLRLAYKYRRQLSAEIVALALDAMEERADLRVKAGAGALPNFTKAPRVSTRRIPMPVPVAIVDQLSLF